MNCHNNKVSQTKTDSSLQPTLFNSLPTSLSFNQRKCFKNHNLSILKKIAMRNSPNGTMSIKTSWNCILAIIKPTSEFTYSKKTSFVVSFKYPKRCTFSFHTTRFPQKYFHLFFKVFHKKPLHFRVYREFRAN